MRWRGWEIERKVNFNRREEMLSGLLVEFKGRVDIYDTSSEQRSSE